MVPDDLAGPDLPGPHPSSSDLEHRILTMLAARAPASTICPSEVARAVARDGARDGEQPEWRSLMEPVRRAARRLVQRGEVQITQQGVVVDPSQAVGPIRIGLPR